MQSVIKISSLLLVAAAVSVATGTLNAQAQLNVYLSSPGSQSTVFTGTQVENFEGFGQANYSTNLTATDANSGTPFGTYELGGASQLAILPNDIYGTNTGQYAAFGSRNSSAGDVVLRLNTPQSYFGFSWNAGDRNNTLTFLRNGSVVGSYTTATTVSILSAPTVTALNGNVYNSSSYFGQPGSGANGGEPYGFLNFIFDNPNAFDAVVFGNSGNSTETGFETDNHTIRLIAPTPGPDFVPVTQDPAVPEPAPIALAAILGGGILGQIVRVRIKNRKTSAE